MTRSKQWAVAVSSTVLAIALSQLILHGPSFYTLLFKGGKEVLRYNLALLSFFPFVVLFFNAVGVLAEKVFKLDLFRDHLIGEGELFLFRLFTGVSIVNLLGFLLGLFGLLYRPFLLVVFGATLLWYFLKTSEIWKKLGLMALNWLFRTEGQDGSGPLPFPQTVLLLLTRWGLVICAFGAFISKGCVFDLIGDDSLQLYSSYLHDAAQNHGSIPSVMVPRFSDFAIGKGNGAYLLFATIANEFAGQLLGYMFLLAVLCLNVALLRRALLTQNRSEPTSFGVRYASALAPLVMLEAVLMRFEPAKYHMQTAAFFFFIIFALSLLFREKSERAGRRILTLALPVASIMISLPHAIVPLAFILLLGAALSWLLFKNTANVRLFALLTAWAGICAGISLGVNWVVTGIPDTNPFRLFSKLIWEDVFRNWTSVDVLIYTGALEPGTPNSSVLQILNFIFYEYFSIGTRKAFVLMAVGLGYMSLILLFLKASIGRVARSESAMKIVTGLLLVLASGAPYFLASPGPAFKEWLPVLVLLFPFALAAEDMAERATLDAGSRPAFAIAILFSLYFILDVVLATLVDAHSLYRLLAHLSFVLLMLLFVGFVRLGNILEKRMGRSQLAVTLLFLSAPTLDEVFSGARWHTLFQDMSLGLGIPFWYGVLILLTAVLFRLIKTFRDDVFAFAACLPVLALLLSVVRSEYHGFASEVSNLDYFLGRAAMLDTNPGRRPDFEKCAAVARALPEGASVLHLNAYQEFGFCAFSPLLNGRKVMHQYQSRATIHFRELMFSPSSVTVPLLKRLGIDYFYLSRNNTYFWGSVYGATFSRESLLENFDVFYEDEKMILLTWRGKGVRPVSAEYADMLVKWIEDSKSDSNPHTGYRALRALQDHH